MSVLLKYNFVDREQIMKKLDPIFDNIKALRTIALIDVLAGNALSIDKTLSQKLDINEPDFGEMVRHLDLDFLAAHQLSQLKLLFKDAEIAALLEKLEERNHSKSDLNNAAPEYVSNLMNDIKLAVSTAKTDVYQNYATSAGKTVLDNNNENVLLKNTLSDETKRFITSTLNQIVRENLSSIVDDIMRGKKEKKSKVLDLSEASISRKNHPSKK